MYKSGFLTFKGSTITKGQVIDLVVLDFSKLWRIWTPKNQEKGAWLLLSVLWAPEFCSNIEPQTTTTYCQQNKVTMPRFETPRTDQ